MIDPSGFKEGGLALHLAALDHFDVAIYITMSENIVNAQIPAALGVRQTVRLAMPNLTIKGYLPVLMHYWISGPAKLSASTSLMVLYKRARTRRDWSEPMEENLVQKELLYLFGGIVVIGAAGFLAWFRSRRRGDG